VTAEVVIMATKEQVKVERGISLDVKNPTTLVDQNLQLDWKQLHSDKLNGAFCSYSVVKETRTQKVA
jgi:hypothetical protein